MHTQQLLAHHLQLNYQLRQLSTAVARFLHLFKFGLVVYGVSNTPRIGGNREIPAYFLSTSESNPPI